MRLDRDTDTITHEYTDENGEVHYEYERTTKSSWRETTSEEPYVKLYLYHLASFLGLPDGAMRTLLGLCANTTLADSVWAGRKRDSSGRVVGDKNAKKKAAKLYLNSELKRDVAESLGVSIPSIDRHLRELCNKGVLRHVGRSTYQINPYYLARGNWAEVLELRATFDYVNGTVTTEMKCADDSEMDC